MAGWITKNRPFSLTNSGTIVPAVADATLRLINIVFTVDSNVDVTIEDEDGKDILPLKCPVASGGWGISGLNSGGDHGWGDTGEGKLMKITLSSAANIRGTIVYQERA